jgi:hypothetical protein
MLLGLELTRCDGQLWDFGLAISTVVKKFPDSYAKNVNLLCLALLASFRGKPVAHVTCEQAIRG